MSVENAKIKIRNRTVEIKWVTQYCDHIMDHYINEHKTHHLSFQQISNIVRKSVFDAYKGRTYVAETIFNNNKYRIFAILAPKYIVIKTCFRYA